MTDRTLPLGEETIAPDEAALVDEFITFLKTTSATRHPSGVMPRFNQGRAAGCVDAVFTVIEGLAPALRIGLFAEPRTHPARIRFANAASQSDTERDVRGMSIEVADVGGENLTPGASHQDFILNSHPVMMADRQLPAGASGGAPRARRCRVRFLRAVSNGQPDDADRGCQR